MAKKDCSKGYGCGGTCIDRSKFCFEDLSDPIKRSFKGFTSLVQKVTGLESKPQVDEEQVQEKGNILTDLIKKSIELGNKDIADLIGRKKEPVTSNTKLLLKTQKEGEDLAAQFIDKDLVDQYVASERERASFQQSKMARAKEKLAEGDNAGAVKILKTEFYDEIDKVNSLIADTAGDESLSEEEKTQKVRELEQEKMNLMADTPMGQAMKSIVDSLKSNVTLGEDEVDDSFVIETGGAGFEEMSSDKEALVENILTEAKTILGLWDKEMIQVGHVEGVDRAYATPYDDVIDQDDKDKKIRNLRGEAREQKLKDYWHSYQGGQLNTGAARTEAELAENIFHEYSHLAEAMHRDLADMNVRWLQSRGDGKVSKLSKLTGLNYSSKEVAYEGDFYDPYVGRKYQELDSVQVSTEVLSMGFQFFHNPGAMVKFFEGDRKHFELILGTILELQRRGNAFRS